MAPDLLCRKFKAEGASRVCASDITQTPTDEGRL
jgi:hypothetical protein